MLTQHLLQLQEWLAWFEFANPWTHPWWFIEDCYLLLKWLLQDYMLISPMFRSAFYISLSFIPLYAFFRFMRSFENFLRLGRGRYDDSLISFLTHTFLEFVITRILRFDVLGEPFIHPMTIPYNGQLANMQERMGPRPRILGVDPMKQETGSNGHAMTNIITIFQGLVERRPELFETTITNGLLCLKVVVPDIPEIDRIDTEREWNDEIAHVLHCGALVVRLHPSDAAEVIRSGWGQRHPLSAVCATPLWRMFYHRILHRCTPVSPDTVIVYAPLNPDQFHVVVSILAAALHFVPEY